VSVFPIKNDMFTRSSQSEKLSERRIREDVRQQKVVTVILLVIFFFQLVSLPGAIMMQSAMDIGTVILGIALCGVAMMFNRLGKFNLVSILLIFIVDLGCGLMLLMGPLGMMPSMSGMTSSDMSSMSTSSMTSSSSMSHMMSNGLDVTDLPVFDLLVVSELIAVSLLPAASIFPVAASNIVFIIGMIVFTPHTAALKALLGSSMGYNAIAQPITLQIVVAVIAYIWVHSALRAAARADRAEEISELQSHKAMLQQREVEQKLLLDVGMKELLHALVQAANGQITRINLQQDNVLWKVGNSVNLLLTRLRRSQQIEQENQRLREQNLLLMQRLHMSQLTKQSAGRDAQQQTSFSGIQTEPTSRPDIQTEPTSRSGFQKETTGKPSWPGTES
jgi:hypothetical protein